MGNSRVVLVWLALVVAFVASVLSIHGCSSDNRDYFVVQYDAGADADEGGAKDEAGVEIDPTIGGPCSEDIQCDDLIPCTYDRCDKAISRCRNTPDDTQCADTEYCNGQEKCRLRQGCVPGAVVSCQDDNTCTIDRCIEASKSCEHLPRDSDGDGDPDDHCAIDKDCDDADPTVSSTRSEVCGNFKDDNCNGQVDEQPCSTAANDDCTTALAVTTPGTFLLNTIAAKKDYATTCTVQNPGAAHDIVVAITVPAGGTAKDVLVKAQTSAQPNEVAVALEATCGQAASEIQCARLAGVPDARAIARNVAAGATVYAIVTTQSESAVDVRVDMLDPGGAPTNETCAAPKPVPVDGAGEPLPFTVSLIDAKVDLASSCNGNQKTGELTYSFNLTTPRDVRIFASTLSGSGSPVVSLRDASCVDELRCRFGSSPPVYARNLQPGIHVFSVAGSTQIDANILVKTYPPTLTPPDQTCATAPALSANVTFPVDLGSHEDAVKNGCFPGGPTAAYKLDITVPSDVLIVGRFPQNDLGAVSLNTPTCGTADLIDCAQGATPQRVSKRNVQPGSYRVVITDQKGLNTSLTVLVRPTVAPVTLTSDGCVNPTDIPETGGFYIGDTTTATADFNAGCDSPGQPIGSAKDNLMRLVLTQKRRMVFDMIGSNMTTLLDLRNGNPCPGIEVPNACNPGFGAQRSFLDFTLDPGTYWVQVDGYSGAFGPWNLDVRALPP